jgi:tetratricopeptide (TPR) repeat protein
MFSLESRMGHWREAEAHLRKAIELDPRNIGLWTKAVQLLYSPLNRYAEAQAAIDRALEISPNDDEAITMKADLYQNQGQLDEAAKWLARIPRDSTNAYAINLRAWQAMDERKFDEAIYWTQQLTKDLKPGKPLSFLETFALLHQGYFQEWAGHHDEARATFQRVVHEIMPTPGSVIAAGRETRSLLALAYAGLGQKEKALEQAHQAAADFANDAYLGPTTEKYLAKVQARCGEVDTAVATLAHLLEVPNGTDVTGLRLTPFYDPLRKNARFQELLNHPPAVHY